jgi:hypothetical protein
MEPSCDYLSEVSSSPARPYRCLTADQHGRELHDQDSSLARLDGTLLATGMLLVLAGLAALAIDRRAARAHHGSIR